MSEKHIDDISGVETTGHEWDGIRELNNPMPRWWVWTFYFTILWAIGYTIAYPAWPLINGATQGLLGWNSRSEIAADMADAKQAQSVYSDRIASSSLAEIGGRSDAKAICPFRRCRRLQGQLHPVSRFGCGRRAGISQPQRR